MTDYRVFDLAMMMQGASEGVTKREVIDEFNVSKSTAERLIKSVGLIFTHIEEFYTDSKEKHWRLPTGTVNNFVSVNAEEMAELDLAIKQAERNDMQVQANTLRRLYRKISSLQKGTVKRKNAADLEALIEAEGFALRPGPRLQIDTKILDQLRHAVLSCTQVDLKYQSRTTGSESIQPVCPYGFLYGDRRHYLVAYNLNEQVQDYRLFSLSNIQEVVRKETVFERDQNFSLQSYAERSFGIFQEEHLHDVVWKFSPKVAADAKELIFHPTQSLEEVKDGSLIVRFKANGKREMDWHLYTWGEDVEDLTEYSHKPLVREV